ncbi:MAG: helix-turn-helix transcriptional regulator, partial [Dongiaceae bacterium]
RSTMTVFSERRARVILACVGFGSYALLLALEIASENGEISVFEFSQDAATLLLTIVSAVGVALLVQRMQVQHEESMALMKQLEVAREEGEAWRSKVQTALIGIKAEMERQFHRWGMTAAEQDVGLLILKGLSHKEIATLRGTSEATVRQQAQAIYKKSGMPGKTAFCAYFLEDLFAPGTTSGNSAIDLSAKRLNGPSAGLPA